MNEPGKLTRDELYQMVWDRPTVQVSAELGISDVMVGKICKRMNVPKPPLGYWRRRETGKSVKNTPLPAATDRTISTVYLNRTVDTSADAIPPEIRTLIEREHLAENQVQISPVLENAHPLVERAGLYFQTVDHSQKEAVSLPQREGYLNISVSAPLVDRALRIMDALIKSLEHRGYEVLVAEDPWRGEATRIRKKGEEIEIALYEQINNVRRELTPDEKKKPPYLILDLLEACPTGKLTVKIRSRYSNYEVWRDRKGLALEDRLNEVMTGVILMLEPLVLDARRKADAEERRREFIRKQEEEKTRREKLEKDAARWAACDNMRNYLKAYRARLIEKHGRIIEGSDEAAWLKWAENYVDSVDPLRSITGGQDAPPY
ncbi:MAG: hypothetical protein IPL32_03665 [Chloracidobacterium sp.]|nr:hypothetical protein [Chloracidobacterium sp.]